MYLRGPTSKGRDGVKKGGRRGKGKEKGKGKGREGKRKERGRRGGTICRTNVKLLIIYAPATSVCNHTPRPIQPPTVREMMSSGQSAVMTGGRESERTVIAHSICG